MDMKRRELLGGATLAAAWAAGGVDIANDAFAASAPAGKIPGGDPERNKRLLRERRADAQMHALPSALPTEAGKFERAAQSPLFGFTPKRSEGRRVGQGCVSTCRSRWSPYN